MIPLFFGMNKYNDSAGTLHSVIFPSQGMVFCVCVRVGAHVLSIVFLNSSEDSLLTNLMLHPYVVVPSAEIATQSPYDLGCLYR